MYHVRRRQTLLFSGPNSCLVLWIGTPAYTILVYSAVHTYVVILQIIGFSVSLFNVLITLVHRNGENLVVSVVCDIAFIFCCKVGICQWKLFLCHCVCICGYLEKE